MISMNYKNEKQKQKQTKKNSNEQTINGTTIHHSVKVMKYAK